MYQHYSYPLSWYSHVAQVSTTVTGEEIAYIEQSPSFYKFCSLQRHNRQLHHLRQKPIAPQFLRDAAHDEFMAERADQERY